MVSLVLPNIKRRINANSSQTLAKKYLFGDICTKNICIDLIWVSQIFEVGRLALILFIFVGMYK